MNEQKQLTPSQLISIAGLPKNQYDTDYLQRFIDFYDISESNVHSLNIELLLSDFDELDNAIDVRSIFTDTPTELVSPNPKNITAIAFYKNVNTDIFSVYYDFTDLACYKAKNIDLFYDLSQVDPLTLTEARADEIRNNLVELGTLEWQDVQAAEKLSDPQSMCIAIRFSDGGLFRASASGILSKCAPANFESVYTLLYDDEH